MCCEHESTLRCLLGDGETERRRDGQTEGRKKCENREPRGKQRDEWIDYPEESRRGFNRPVLGIKTNKSMRVRETDASDWLDHDQRLKDFFFFFFLQVCFVCDCKCILACVCVQLLTVQLPWKLKI